ncbi:hypothetical protein [Microbacterium sp. cf332]|uniref:hypothetical protein n=1 Tax=Microbacterium sp. cf332 TaxID=1761804 RepID=UPI00088895F6|nr:hypothetical protein [Microbacterium sp. cf332]SDQ64330.1 hypothetical protein SAMN04487847_2199 [Microbacterium sp. cf332]
MRKTLDKTVTGAFALAMMAFLALACALVLTQIVGVVFVLPDVVTTAETLFKGPAIVGAVVVSLLGYALFNIRGEKPAES